MISLTRRKEFSLPGLVLLVILIASLVISLAISSAHTHAAVATPALPSNPLIGFGAGTTGGAGGSSVTVTTASAFNSAISGSTPRIIYVKGVIHISGAVYVGSNKSIIGLGGGAGFTGGGLEVSANHNVIFRNLVVSYSVGVAGIRVRGGNHVWIDHNTIYSDRNHGPDYYDGLINITKGSDDVTVSWNILRDDYETSLIGASDSDGSLDKGHEKVTFYDNWLQNDTERGPSLRFGTGHVFNNYYQNFSNAVHSRMGAQMLVENNYFQNVGVAITTTGSSSQDGYAVARGNIYNGATVTITHGGSLTHVPYSYSLVPAASVPSLVMGGAGAH